MYENNILHTYLIYKNNIYLVVVLKKLTNYQWIASKKIHVLCAAPSHSTVTNVKSKSKLHVAITLKDGTPFLL